jgi:hypothetical protein
LSLIVVASAAAQDDRRFEAGAQITTLRLGEFDTTDIGVGVQAGWRLGPVLTIDGALTFFPRNGEDGAARIDGQRKVLGVAGVRLGGQAGPVELFARARPGFLAFAAQDFVACIAIFPTPLECQVLAGETTFVTEIGGGIRVALGGARRAYLSVDVGDLLVRYGFEALRPNGETTEDGFVSHNLVAGVGVGWRF